MTEDARNVGSELQRAREARGLALSEVAQQLKFAPRQLEALEQDRFDLLPGGTFARGMVRNYARLLRIDPEPLVRRVADRYEAPDANNLAARYRQTVPFSDSARRSTFVYLALSLAVLALGAGVAWQWYHDRNRSASLARAQAAAETPRLSPSEAPRPVAAKAEATPAEAGPRAQNAKPKAQEARPKAQEAKPKAPAEGAKMAPVEVAAAKADAATPDIEKAAAKPKPPPVAKVAPGVHRLVIRCEEEAWIEVRDANDRALVSSLNPAGAQRIVQARGPLTLVIGNARHVQILHNDQPLDLAPYTKVETARLLLP